MTENRRIALNTLATYGRSLFTLACSLFTSRWIRMALGQSDCGLRGSVARCKNSPTRPGAEQESNHRPWLVRDDTIC